MSSSSANADPYLEDHILEGERWFPAVMALEAMAQTAAALRGCSDPPQFTDVEFLRPVIVPENGGVETLRLAALNRKDGVVQVAVRCAQTGFKTDHFRALCRFGERLDRRAVPTSLEDTIALTPEGDLYGPLLFHGGRFRRLLAYRHLEARRCCAEVGEDKGQGWFGRYLPAFLLLGDPGARDAALHALQACVPQARLLPVGVDRLTPGAIEASGPWIVDAEERWHRDDLFCYDVEVRAADGRLRERWEGLRLRKATDVQRTEPWPAALLAPYLERRLNALLPGVDLHVELVAGAERQARREHAVIRLLGQSQTLLRRPDGKPEVAEGHRQISIAHAEPFTLTVVSEAALGCDLEPTQRRPDPIWQDLLGAQNYPLIDVISHATGEDRQQAATRVWCARECLKKIGEAPRTPLILLANAGDGWVTLGAGGRIIATCVVTLQGSDSPMVTAVLVEPSTSRQRVYGEAAVL